MIKNQQPNRRIYLVGFSLDASILPNYLGQEGENSQIEGSCVIAAPWDLNICYHSLHSTWLLRFNE